MVAHTVPSEGIGRFLEQGVSVLLPSYRRVRDLEEGSSTLCFEDASAKRLLRFEIGRPKHHLWLVVFAYEVRPNLSAVLNRGLPNASWRCAEIGALPTGPNDRKRLLRWLEHYSRHAQLLDFHDPLLHRFLDAFVPDEHDLRLANETVGAALSTTLFALRGDIASSELRLPLGKLFVEHDAGYISPSGRVPAFARLALDSRQTSSAHGWFAVTTIAFVPGFFMSAAAREQAFAAFFDSGKKLLDSAQPWRIASDGERAWVDLVKAAGELTLQPSQAFVTRLNRDQPAFIRAIEGKLESEWRAIYEHAASAANPIDVLQSKILAAPEVFENYKALADYYAATGHPGPQNVALALGYLRAKGLAGIARGKLSLASQADPKCPGLEQALRELESVSK